MTYTERMRRGRGRGCEVEEMGVEFGNVVRSTECICKCTRVQQLTVSYVHTYVLTHLNCVCRRGMCVEWSSGVGVFRGEV